MKGDHLTFHEVPIDFTQEEHSKDEHNKKKTEELKYQIKMNYIVIILVALAQGVQSLSDLALSYFYKDELHLHPFEVTQITSILTIPWIIKPIYGFISDSFPLYGYRRKSYLFIMGIIVSISWLLMGLYVKTYTQTICVLMIIAVTTAFYNVIGEALVVELSQKQKEFDPDAGAKNVSLYFLIRSCGNLFSSLFIGPLLIIMDKRHIFLLTACLPVMLIISSIILIEKTPEEQKKEEQKVGVNYGTIENSTHSHPIPENEVKDQINLFFSFIKKPIIYKPVIFILCFFATPSYSDPMFYFYTNELNFSPLIMGRLKLVYGVASVSGIFIYNKFLRNYSFKGIIIFTTLLCIILNMGSIVLVKRYNIDLGIPDIIFCFMTDALTTALGEINTMPLLVLACNICPKNIEGTLYAFLMSVSNFGSMLSSQLGSKLSIALGITNSNFDNLAMMILIANVFLILPLPVMYCVDDSAYNSSTDQPKTEEENKQERKLTNGAPDKYLSIKETINTSMIDSIDMNKSTDKII